MQVFHTFEELRAVKHPIHWAIGFFDGVHTGHVQVMHSAKTPGALRGVLTFAQHPLALLQPSAQPRLLTPTPQHKLRLFDELGGADIVLQLPFTAELAALRPRQFLDILESVCHVVGISVGENWHFGCGGSGDSQFLTTEGSRRGWRVCVCPLATYANLPISSRRIRAALTAGQMAETATMLGHPFSIVGKVEHGQQLARRLGFPTANLPILRHSSLPPAGVYAVSCPHAGTTLHGIANLGLRPTIAEHRKLPRLEVHFPDWHGNIYGVELCVDLHRFLRPEREFVSLNALQQQVFSDIAALQASSANAAGD